MLITLARTNQIEMSLLFLIEDEVFVQICLDQRWIESITALFSAFSRCLQFINIFGYHFDFFFTFVAVAMVIF